MDFVPLIDSIGEPAAALTIGLVLGAAFGALALLSGFCTRSAVINLFSGQPKSSVAVWLIAFAIAIAGTQLLLAQGLLDVDETRFFATAQSLSGALVGGAVFGIGMILTRGCVSRLMVLGAAGNLRAVFSVCVIALAAWATIGGPLVPLRNAIGGLWMSSDLGTNSVQSLIGLDAGLSIAAAIGAIAILVAVVTRLSPLKAIAGLSVGALLPAGWYATYQLSQQVFEPIQAESLSFVRPLSTSIDFAASAGAEQFLGLDVGMIAGTLIGAFVAAIAFGRFRIQTFAEPGTPHIGRYALGSAFMGFGGVLAVGCTIGAGFTGGSVLAINSLLALSAMVSFAALAHWAIEVRPMGKRYVVAAAQ